MVNKMALNEEQRLSRKKLQSENYKEMQRDREWHGNNEGKKRRNDRKSMLM